MIEIFWDTSFKKSYKKRTQNSPALKRKLILAILKFEENPLINLYPLTNYQES